MGHLIKMVLRAMIGSFHMIFVFGDCRSHLTTVRLYAGSVKWKEEQNRSEERLSSYHLCGYSFLQHPCVQVAPRQLLGLRRSPILPVDNKVQSTKEDGFSIQHQHKAIMHRVHEVLMGHECKFSVFSSSAVAAMKIGGRLAGCPARCVTA